MDRLSRIPILPTRGGLALALIGFGVFGAAQTTGAGWLMVLASLIIATLLVGAIVPAFGLRKVRIDPAGPTDAVAGRAFNLTIQVKGPRLGVTLALTSLDASLISVGGPSSGTIKATSARRGVITQLGTVVTSSAPFDLFTTRRSLTFDLPTPIFVAPHPTPMRLPVQVTAGPTGDGLGNGGSGSGEVVRSLREYSAGDPLRMVHWRASAGSPDLLVKELEPPERPHLALIVDVSGPNGDHTAERAAGLVQAARREGLPITLCTFEGVGPVIGEVGSIREAGRRLAAAVPGLPPRGPLPPGAEVILLDSEDRMP